MELTTAEVKEIAGDWISRNASRIPGFCGAFFGGSINWTDDGAEWPKTSDVDVFVIVDSIPASKLVQRKFLYNRVLLEVSAFDSERFQTAEHVLSDYPMACHFAVPSLIADPTGKLNELHNEVAEHYAEKKWIRTRIQQANENVLSEIGDMISPDPKLRRPFYIFLIVAKTAQTLLLGSLLNPTWRKALVISREILAAINSLSLHEKMLKLLGSVDMDFGEVESHFTQCVTAFDYAKEIICTPFFGDFAISDVARPIYIDGSREILDMGYHREALLWILVVRALCQIAIDNDAPENQKDQYDKEYRKFLRRLGLRTFQDYEQRAVLCKETLKETTAASERIINKNPDVNDSLRSPSIT